VLALQELRLARLRGAAGRDFLGLLDVVDNLEGIAG